MRCRPFGMGSPDDPDASVFREGRNNDWPYFYSG